MTVTYDGRLRIVSNEKKIEPCCHPMHYLIAVGSVRQGTILKKPVLKATFETKEGGSAEFSIWVCPFCGAKLEVV